MANSAPWLPGVSAEQKGRIETQLAAYGTTAGPGEAFLLFPEQIGVGEVVTPEPLPMARRVAKPAKYVSGSQNSHWIEQMRKLSGPRPRPSPPAPAIKRDAWQTSPSGKWRSPLPMR